MVIKINVRKVITQSISLLMSSVGLIFLLGVFTMVNGQTSGGTIHGTVKEADTSIPLGGINVVIVETSQGTKTLSVE